MRFLKRSDAHLCDLITTSSLRPASSGESYLDPQSTSSRWPVNSFTESETYIICFIENSGFRWQYLQVGDNGEASDLSTRKYLSIRNNLAHAPVTLYPLPAKHWLSRASSFLFISNTAQTNLFSLRSLRVKNVNGRWAKPHFRCRRW